MFEQMFSMVCFIDLDRCLFVSKFSLCSFLPSPIKLNHIVWNMLWIISFMIDISRSPILESFYPFHPSDGPLKENSSSEQPLQRGWSVQFSPTPATGGSCSGCHDASAARIGHSSKQPPAKPTSSPTSPSATTTTPFQAS